MAEQDQEPTKPLARGEVHDPCAERERGQPSAVPHMDSTCLLNGANRIFICHRGTKYELRETRQGKLILTK